MKSTIKQAILFLSLFLFIGITGCEKNDKDSDFGEAKIYIPQGLVTGSNLNYAVPKGLDSASRNYIIDEANDKVNVLLGVARSGKISPDGYTVNVTTKPDTINTLISGNVLTNTVLLPESMYSLPKTITVPQGQNSASFYLSINKTQLKANYTGKNIALAVMITDPTKYVLNVLNNKVIVIIDVNALNL